MPSWNLMVCDGFERQTQLLMTIKLLTMDLVVCISILW